MLTYRGIVFDAIREVGGRWELVSDSDSAAEDERLTHRDAAAGGVVQRHGAVDDVTLAKTPEVVDAWCHEYHPEIFIVLKQVGKWRNWQAITTTIPTF